MMHQVAADRLREEFLECAGNLKVCHPAQYRFFWQRIHSCLDNFNDWSQRATNWDADEWGLSWDPILSMLLQRMSGEPAGGYWPTEPQMRFPEGS
jgi:predicted 3-demethylubiquinone-9 3-methyltransferase (glyoxalase superfamily)